MRRVDLVMVQVGQPWWFQHQDPPWPGWSAQELSAFKEIAQPISLDAWPRLEQQVRLVEKWHEYTAAHHLLELEAQFSNLEPELEEAREKRRQLGKAEQNQFRSIPGQIASRKGGLWNWLRPSSPVLPSQPQSEAQDPVIMAAQQHLETLASEVTRVKKQIHQLRQQRLKETFADVKYQQIWFVLPAKTATKLMQQLQEKHGVLVWKDLPHLVTVCPVGIIPEGTDGRPGEREPSRWYFRTGLLALELLGVHEHPEQRQELEDLEEWITREPARASELACSLEGLGGTP